MNQINSILLVCIGNICRSPYAEIKLKELMKLSKQKIYQIESAGIHAMVNDPAHFYSIKVAKENNLNLKNHTAKQVTIEFVKKYDLILVMEEEQKKWIEKKFPFSKGKVHLIGKWRNLIIDDPYDKPYESYVEMAKNIDACLADWIQKIELKN